MLRALLISLSFCVFALAHLSPASAAGLDFLSSEKITAAVVQTKLDAIKIAQVPFASAEHLQKLNRTRAFVAEVKRGLVTRIKDGRVKRYQADDVVQELETFAYAMNRYFANLRQYERRASKEHRTLADENLRNAEASYARLVTLTRSSGR